MKKDKSKKVYDDEECCDDPCDGLDYYEDVIQDEDIDGLSDNDNWSYWLGMSDNDNADGGSARLKRIGKRWSEQD